MGTCRTWVHCSMAVGSRSATKLKKLRNAEQAAVACAIVSPRSCSVCCRKSLPRRAFSRPCELGYRPASALSHEPEEQAPCVTVGPDGVRRGISLLNHPLVKEGMKQPWERVDRFHGRTLLTCAGKRRVRPEAFVCFAEEILG